MTHYSEKFIQRFWSRVEKSEGPDGCWLWKAGGDSSGYGVVSVGTKKSDRAHRVSLELSLGRKLAPEMCALHRCVKTRRCVNPDHLYEGTKKENGADKAKDGTQKGIIAGEANPKSKLTKGMVEEIIRLSGEGHSRKSLAEQFGVSPPTISKVALGRTWIAPK